MAHPVPVWRAEELLHVELLLNSYISYNGWTEQVTWWKFNCPFDRCTYVENCLSLFVCWHKGELSDRHITYQANGHMQEVCTYTYVHTLTVDRLFLFLVETSDAVEGEGEHSPLPVEASEGLV